MAHITFLDSTTDWRIVMATGLALAEQGPTATILLTVYDGTRNQVSNDVNILLRVRDGQQQERFSRYVKGPRIVINVPFFDNLFDNYTVLVSADGYRDAGFVPVKVSATLPQPLDLMLVPKNAQFQFITWDALKSGYSRFSNFLAIGSDDATARGRYEGLRAKQPPALASLLNLTAAMSVIHLPQATPLDYFKEILWDDSLAQDRFFGFADPAIVDQVRTAAAQGEFAPDPGPGLFHKGATSSYKQIQFGEANVQLTFHEDTTKLIGDLNCIEIEPDIDYYKDLGAHALLEVVPNLITHGLTDPQTVYVLRWIAGRHAGVPEFDPAYTLA